MLLLFVLTQPGFSQNSQERADTEQYEENEQASAPDESPAEVKSGTIKRFLIASGETLLSNLVLFTYNISILGETWWAIPTYDSVYNNFTEPWMWEEGEGFMVNHLGHSILGNYHYNAGRVNGFNFYQSAMFTMLGSAAWEAVGENAYASINDFIVSSIGGMTMGEIIYRLYLETTSAGVPAFFRFILNPIASFHSLLTGWEPPDYGRNIHQFQTYMGASFVNIDHSIFNEVEEEVYSFRGFLPEMGIKIIYGNPFLQESYTPYDHFELIFNVGVHLGKYVSLRLISDGYLFSFCPVDSEKNMMSTGLSLHLDYTNQGDFDGNCATIDHFSNALDWTIKYQHMFSEDFAFQIKSHAGFTFFGVSEYPSPPYSYTVKNYGFGTNEKLYIILDHKKLGKLEASIFHYTIWSNPNTSNLSKGTVNFIFTELTYSYFFNKHLSVNLNGYFAWEWGRFGNYPDTNKSNKSAKVYVAWDI
ncbi:MAG: DUF3943 domain-containing protein [Treponema sp.]|nr:DUF3943 domain-containing protein [Treponema sp.]